MGMANGPETCQGHAADEAQEDGHSSQTRQGTGMQVAFLSGNGNPSVSIGEVTNKSGQRKR